MVAQVPYEVAHHPGPELLRGQGQRQNGDGEDHPDGGDDGGSDGDQDLPTGIRTSRLRPPGQTQMVVVGRQVDLEGDGEQDEGDHHEDGGDHPKGRSQRLDPPVGGT